MTRPARLAWRPVPWSTHAAMQRATLIADLGFARLQLTLDAWQRTDGKAEWAIGGANMLLPAVAQTLAEAKVAAEDCAEKLCELGLRAARGEA